MKRKRTGTSLAMSLGNANDRGHASEQSTVRGETLAFRVECLFVNSAHGDMDAIQRETSPSNILHLLKCRRKERTMYDFNEKVTRALTLAPARLTVSEWNRLQSIKDKADIIKADPDANKRKTFTGKDARWLSALLGHIEAPKSKGYTKFVLKYVDKAYNKYDGKSLSKDRYTVYTAMLNDCFVRKDGTYAVKFSRMRKTANTVNGVYNTMNGLGMMSITLNTNDIGAVDQETVDMNDALFSGIANKGLNVVDDNGDTMCHFITAVHGASNQRNGVSTLVSTDVPSNSKLYGMSDDEKRIALWKTLLGHGNDDRPLVDVLDELSIGKEKLAKMMSRIFVDTSGSFNVAEILPDYAPIYKGANILYLSDVKSVDGENDVDIEVLMNVIDTQTGKVSQQMKKESACNGMGAADTKYFIAPSIIDGQMRRVDGARFYELYVKYGESVRRAMASLDGEEFTKLYDILKKAMQFRMKWDGKKGMLGMVCMNDLRDWLKSYRKYPNMNRAYYALKDCDVIMPKELVKFNTNQTFDALEVCRTENEAKGYTLLNHQFMETFYTDVSPFTKRYFDLRKGVSSKDIEKAAKCALALLNAMGDHTMDPDDDGSTHTNPYDLACRIESNYSLVQEPNTRKELYRLTDKFFSKIGIAKVPVAGGSYTLGIVDFFGYLDKFFGCEVKHPYALKGEEVYLNGQTGECVMNRAPVTHTSEGQLGIGVENDFYKHFHNVLICSVDSGFAFRMSNGDYDGDQFHTTFGNDEMTKQIIADFKANDKGTCVCEVNEEILFGQDNERNDGIKFKGPYDSDAQLMQAYKEFIVATRNSSKVGIINDCYERIVSARQHLEYLLDGAKKIGATFNFVNKAIVVNGVLRPYLYDKNNNVIVTTHLVRKFNKNTGEVAFLLDGNCTVSDVEKALAELNQMESLASIAMQLEVDSAKNTGKSVKNDIIQYLTIDAVPFHMIDRAVLKNKKSEQDGEIEKFDNHRGKAQLAYISGSNLGKLNAAVTNQLREIKDIKAMTMNARNMGIDMLSLLTENERLEVMEVYEDVIELNKEYVGAVTEAIAKRNNPFEDNVNIVDINKDIVNKAYTLAEDKGVSVLSVAAAMFLNKQLKASVRMNKEKTEFQGYNFCWLLGDCITKIFARDDSMTMIPVNVGRENYGKVLTLSNGWLYNDEGHKVAKVPVAQNNELCYIPMFTAHGDSVVYVKKDNNYKKEAPVDICNIELPVYYCEKNFAEWKTLRKQDKDILVTFIIVNGAVCLKMKDEVTEETAGTIFHKDSDWSRIFTASSMVGHTYKVQPTSKREKNAYVLKFSLAD